jgi:hypothetical protein
VIEGLNITNSSVGAVEELGNLTGLEELHVQVDGGGSQEYKMREEMLLSALGKLGSCKLQSLRIISTDPAPLQFLDYLSPLPSSLQRFRMTSSYYLPKTPKWIAPAHTSITYLNINLAKVTEEDLRILGEMTALLSLDLTFKCVQKERLTIGCIAFPCLKEFYLRPTHRKASCAIYLAFEEGALPKLEKLKLPFSVLVAKACGFNLGLGHLPCLRDAKITVCGEFDTPSESRAAEAAITNEANSHPNRPTVIFVDHRERLGF